ncbi:50S ribosomal protein L4 [Candidatus Woesearchaeota archaeon]|nr:50S ribosomal protein L4 [Candidatus Woesearchaeota archaeon]
MKIAILNKEKKEVGHHDLPVQFNEEFRPDLIQRAVAAYASAQRQPIGGSPLAGLRHSSKLSKRRRNYRGSYGFGISRDNRKIMSRRGMRMNWVAAYAPHVRGGHRAHPPKAQKDLVEQINVKERRKAIRSAIAATMDLAVVTKRGHKVPTGYPFVIETSFESISKTKDVVSALTALGFSEELERSGVKKIRAGVGKLRSRPYKRKKGVLVVVGEKCPLLHAARNIAGLDIVCANSLNVNLLAPGALPGRVTLWTASALEILEKKRLFI